MSDPQHDRRVDESAPGALRSPDTADESLLIGDRMTFRERLAWNESMVGLWARWHPELAHQVWMDRISIR